MKADVAAVLARPAGRATTADLDRAAASAEISPVQIAPGTRIPFMASRKNKKAHALMDVLWAGKKPIDAFALRVLLELRALPARDAEGLQQLLGRGARQGHDRSEVPWRRRPRRRSSSVSGASETCVTQPVEYAVTVQEPAGRQQGQALRERQGARLRQAHERLVQASRSPARRRPGTYEVKAVSGGVSGTTTRRRSSPACRPAASPRARSRPRPASPSPSTSPARASRPASRAA